MSSRKRLTWRTLREASDRPFLCASSSSSTTIGRYTSCSSKRKIAVGSWISTFVSSTTSRRPARGRLFSARASPEAAVGPGSDTPRCFKHCLRVTGNLYLAPLLPQPPAAVEQEGAALDAEILSAVQAFRFYDVEQPADALIGIGEEREGERFALRELVVRGGAVARYAHDLSARLAEGAVQVAEVLRFARTSRGHVARVEVDHQLPTGRVLQAPRAAARRGQGEFRHFAPRLDRWHFFQDLTGSRMASRFSESQNSMNSSRRCAS